MASATRTASEPVDIAPRNGAQAARAEGLRYVVDSEPGIRRVRRGRGFAYIGPDGRRVTSDAELGRIRALAIPPAYRDVWICAHPAGHLQATGRDARGRKQYRYHPRWRTHRDATKFDRTLEFGRALPRIRRRIAADLRKPGLPREKVLATVVRLLEATLVRVGNEEYVRANGSYGLTTLRDGHVDIDGTTLRFEFRGKSGVIHRVSIDDPAMARIVARCRDIPGQELFQWIDEGGERRRIDSTDVNDYLREISGGPFTAKDFRTWFATVETLEQLRARNARTMREAQRDVSRAVESIAGRLNNTPAVCRKCYIHPVVLTRYLEDRLCGLQGLTPAAALCLLLGRPVRRGRRAGRRARVRRATPHALTRGRKAGGAQPSESRA